jgi:hypothetical protein
VLGVFLVDVQVFGSFLVLFPRGIDIDHIEFTQSPQIILMEIFLQIDGRVVPLLDPDLLLLHELLGFWIAVVALGLVHVLDEVLGTLARLHELGVETAVLFQD